jgi:D-tyrosyl-tRNA(Tyr) deacylase
MRAVIQRVKEANVTVDGQCVGKIGAGMLVLLGLCHGDTTRHADYIVRKICGMRIFSDENAKMNLNLQAIGGSVLLVSQFTLYADARHGNRPGFDRAMRPQEAEPLYEYTARRIEESGIPVQTGVFGADMRVNLCGDGPVTILLDTEGAVQ